MGRRASLKGSHKTRAIYILCDEDVGFRFNDVRVRDASNLNKLHRVL